MEKKITKKEKKKLQKKKGKKKDVALNKEQSAQISK